MPPLLDTHIWIWWMLGDLRLKKAERDALNAFPSDARPALCDISLWEAALLVGRGAVQLNLGLEYWLDVAASPAAVSLKTISPAIVAEMNRLPDSFHRDPADRLMVATARVLKLPVATRDAKIIRSRLVKIWRP